MTNDGGRERDWPEAFFRSAQVGYRCATVRGEPLDLVARQTNVSVARLTEWRDRACRCHSCSLIAEWALHVGAP
jgi:hypothetical protein